VLPIDPLDAAAEPQHAGSDRPFRITVPDGWSEQGPAHANDPWALRSADGNEPLTVSVIPHVRIDDEATAIEACGRIVEHSREAVRQVSGPSVQLGEVLHGQIGDTLAARYSAVEPNTNHRVWTLVLCSQAYFDVFLYERIGASADEIDASARALFNSVVIP